MHCYSCLLSRELPFPELTVANCFGDVKCLFFGGGGYDSFPFPKHLHLMCGGKV